MQHTTLNLRWHHNLKAFLFTLLAITLANVSLASQDIELEQQPEWVVDIALPATDKLPMEQIQQGVHYALLDSQIKVEANAEPVYFVRRADHIVNISGVEQSSQINISYDPTYQTLRLHSLQIIRDKQNIDKFASARISHLQREEEMDQLIYNGRKTLNIILDDVRVGDTVLYSYSIEGMNPVYQGLFAYETYLGWSVPVGRASRRILWNKASPLYYRIENSDAQVNRNTTTSGDEYHILVNNPAPVNIEKDTPEWFDPWGRVIFSEVQSWAEVARWSEPLYQGAYTGNTGTGNTDIKTLIQNIKADNDSLEAQISAALRFTQDEIRYLGIELGENSHKPTPALETMRQRYGDCKDKTVLLLSLLRELGVEAYPALVNTQTKLEDTLPNIQAFDHVITMMRYNGKRYWLDPTRSYQHGGIDDIHQPDYGSALVLDSATKDLTPMRPDNKHQGVFVTDRFTVPENGPVLFSTETINHGWNAERQRHHVASKGLDKLQQNYLNYLQSYYPGAAVESPLAYSDDTQKNTFAITEHYRIDEFWTDKPDKGRKEADFFANIAGEWIYPPDQLNRNQPLYLTHPYQVKQTIEIEFESDDWTFDNEQELEDNDFFRFGYAAHYEKSRRKLTLTYNYLSKVAHIPADRYAEYRSALERADVFNGYGIYKSTGGETTTETGFNYFNATNLILLYVGLYLLVFALWRIDRRRHPDSEKSLFFPVKPLKLIVMWILTFGLYGAYWFYRNFRYAKEQANDASMPIARGIFYGFWYYPLWRILKDDCEQRYEDSHLPGKPLAVILALALLVFSFAAGIDALVIPAMLACTLLVLPLANYVAFINGHDSAALIKNSRWLPRHFLLIVLSLPLCVLSVGSEIGLLPNDAVIQGNRLLSHDIKFMQRKGIIKPSDTIEYFYSDSLFFIQDDGNGFTQRHVFSYWKDDDNTLKKETVEYADIEKIDVAWGNNITENSTVTITRKDGGEFLLFVSRADYKDAAFVRILKDNWHNSQN